MTPTTIAKRLLRPYVRAARAIVNRRSARRHDPKDLWARRRSKEVTFWDRWVRTRGSEWSATEFAERVSADTPLAGTILELVNRVPSNRVSIIDVGSGPATTVGKKHPTKEILLTAIDPLARDYNQMLKRQGVTPAVVTLEGTGEALLEQFRPKTFDIAHSHNALDHSFDPIAALSSMLGVARHFVILEHERNEAEHQRYGGLHNWNFDVQDGRFVIWNLRERHDVEAELGIEATINMNGPWLTIVFDLQLSRFNTRSVTVT